MFLRIEKCRLREKWDISHSAVAQVPAGECFMEGFDAGAAVPSDGSGLDGRQACGGGGGGPRGRNPPQKTRVETPPNTLQTQRKMCEIFNIVLCITSVKCLVNMLPQQTKCRHLGSINII